MFVLLFLLFIFVRTSPAKGCIADGDEKMNIEYGEDGVLGLGITPTLFLT